MLWGVLAQRLGIEQLVDHTVGLGDRPGAANSGRKVMTMVSATALGADCIEDCDVPALGPDGRCSGIALRRPRRWDVLARVHLRARRPGGPRAGPEPDAGLDGWPGPRTERLVVDVDSFVGEVHGRGKQGASFGDTHKRGYHPILATRAATGEVLHIRCRKGSVNTARGALRFVEELIPRVARAGATVPKLLRADSGFWKKKTMARLQKAGWTCAPAWSASRPSSGRTGGTSRS